MSTGQIHLERRGHVLVIGIDRVAKRNAFDLAMWEGLCRAYGELERDAELRVGVPVTTLAKWKTTAQLVAIGFLLAGEAGDVVVTSIVGVPGLYVTGVGLDDTHLALVLLYGAFQASMETLMLKTFIDAVPAELEEAAMIDGATRFGAFRRIVLPLAAPGLLAAALYAFTQAWNEFLYALVFVTNVKLRTLPVGLSTFITGDVYGWGYLMAGAVLQMLLFLRGASRKSYLALALPMAAATADPRRRPARRELAVIQMRGGSIRSVHRALLGK
jgi:ABC-type Fe3+ transport system permease subunit